MYWRGSSGVFRGNYWVDDEHLDLGMPLHHLGEYIDHALRRQVLLGIPLIQIFMIIGADRPQDVQTFAATPDRHLQALPPEQPAIEQRLLPPHRMDAIEEVAPHGP